jgi:H/ACA ribonucleoprotein complex subunit 1
MVCALTEPTKVPYFNAPIYLQNKTQIGKVDEILGPINQVFFTVKMEQGMNATSFKKDDKVYIGGDKLLPIERFLPKPKVAGAKREYGARSGDGELVCWSPIVLAPLLYRLFVAPIHSHPSCCSN